jgi:Arabinose-binding domain of AraC transcription regulator, N-term
MVNRFRVSSTLPRKLEELGLSPEAVLRQAGLPMALFNQEKILVSTEEFFALYRGIAEAANDPGFGLKLGTEERIERYDPIKIAALSARSFRGAVERLSRYKQTHLSRGNPRSRTRERIRAPVRLDSRT